MGAASSAICTDPAKILISDERKEQLREAFDAADVIEKNGVLEREEFINFIHSELPQLDHFTNMILKLFGKGKKKKMTFERLLQFYNALEKDDTDPDSLCMVIFNHLDKDNNYFISSKEIIRLHKWIYCEKLKKKKAQEIIDNLNPANPSGLSRDEFIRFFKSQFTSIEEVHNEIDENLDPHVYAAGVNSEHQLGVLTPNRSLKPVEVELTLKYNLIHVAAGHYHTVFVYSDGFAYATGSDKFFQIGNNTSDFYTTPVPVNVCNNVIWAACGEQYTAYLQADGKICYCGPQCFSKTDLKVKPKPIILEGEKPFVYVYGSQYSIAAIDQKGAVYLYDTMVNHQPRKSIFPRPAYDVVCGRTNLVQKEYALVCTIDGTIYGNQAFNKGSNAFIPITRLSQAGVYKLFGYNWTCAALTRNGDVYIWGCNSNGQLGTGNTNSSNEFIKVEFDQKIKDVAIGSEHTLFVACDGNLYSCGNNRNGQLFLGNNKNENKPSLSYEVKGKVSNVVCGANHSIVITDSRFIIHPGMKQFGIDQFVNVQS